MNTTPEVGTLEYCQAKLNEWRQQAEAATKERADLLERLQKAEQQLSQVQSDYKILRKADQQLKEAVELLDCVENYEGTIVLEGKRWIEWTKIRDAFLASQKDAK